MKFKRNLVVGVDIGGTFTDFVILNKNSGEVYTWKTLTTPIDPSQAVVDGLDESIKYYGFQMEDVEKIVHGTTLVTNAIIERKGATTGLITTKGFRDTLEIGREIRYDLYDLFLKQPEPLIPRKFRKEVTARSNVDGEVQQELNHDELLSVAYELVNQGVKSIAISFLHANINNDLEMEAKELLREKYPDLYVSISSEVASEVGEFERTSTVVANAYVRPLMENYLTRLEKGLTKQGLSGDFYIMLSSGGFCDVEVARQFPIRLLESGPAAGALSASYWGEVTGNPHVIGFDMGGTTAKACLIDNGKPESVFEFEAGRVHRFKRGSGLPILIPTVELIEIGAGGGSIAHVDSLGLLKVGPQSASSEPGPASYNLGGTEPTVTDADLMLGYLNPDFFLGGKMPLNREKGEKALTRSLSKPLDLNSVKAAWGIHTVVNENMARAARVYTAEKGRDHRKYTLVATGGAGPVHAFGIARSLNLKQVIYPSAAGVSSALGMLVVPAREDLSQTFFSPIDQCDWTRANRILLDLEKTARQRLMKAGIPKENIYITRFADIQYTGQGHSVTVPLPNELLSQKLKDKIIDTFEEQYQQLYANTVQDGKPELVSFRLKAVSTEQVPDLKFYSKDKDGEKNKVIKGYRSIFLPASEEDNVSGEFQSVPVYDRYCLQPGTNFEGPCIIEEKESTIVINGQAEINVDEYFNVVANLGSSKSEESVVMQIGGAKK